MEKMELLEKNKNKIINFGIIFLALFISLQIYKSDEQQIHALIREKSDEQKKNSVTEEVAVLEKKIEGYKKVFAKKDMSSVVEAISTIAKSNGVNIVSIKPIREEANADYVKSTFLIAVSSPDYHSLGNFISQIEASKDVYMVSEVSVRLADSRKSTESINTELSVNLRISTIAY